LSTTKAKYVTAATAGAKVIWLRGLHNEMGSKLTKGSRMHMDNQSAISVAKNPKHHGRMKHLDLRYFGLREKVTKGEIYVEYVPTEDMVADILTKALPRETIERHRSSLGLK
jgi:hypothetical protein